MTIPKLDKSIIERECLDRYVIYHLEPIAREVINEMKPGERIDLQELVTLFWKSKLINSRKELHLIFRALQNVALERRQLFVTIPSLIDNGTGGITCENIEFELCYMGDYE